MLIKLQVHETTEKVGSVLIDTTLQGLLDCVNAILMKVKDVKDKEL